MRTELYSGIGELEENVYVITDEASGKQAVIDPDFAVERPEFTDLELILLTHAHFDHIKSAGELRTETGAEICILEADAEALTDPDKNLSSYFGGRISIKADRLLHDGDKLMLGETEVEVMATPGHTAGGCCYYADTTIFTGDTLMKGTVGRTDFPTGDYGAIIASVKEIAKLPEDTRVLCGHGEPTTIGWERSHNPYITRKDSNDFIY